MNNNENVKKETDLENASEYSLLKTISYGSLWFTDATILAFFGLVVFYFYEVEVGLDVTLVAVAFVIFAIWNMINDPLLGYLTEKPRAQKLIMKYGFRTPLILISDIFLIIIFFLIFLPPENTGEGSQLIIFLYMVILVCLMDAFYTIYNSHMAAGAINMFTKDTERRKVGAIAIILSALGTVAVSAIIVPNFIVYGDRQSFVLAAGMTAAVMVINIIVYSYGIIEPKNVKEYYITGRDIEKGEQISMKEVIKTAMKNKNFIVYITTFLFFAIAYNLFYASQVYFYKDVLKVDFGYFMYGMIAFFIGFLIGMVLWLNIAKKYGHSNVYGVGYILFGCVFFTFLWVTSLLELYIYMFIGGIMYAASASILLPVQADTYDEITSKIGVHQEATLQGITNFFIRLAYLFVGVIIAVVHIMTDYNPDPHAAQTPLAILGVRIHSGLIPAIFLIIGGISFLLIYDLKDDKRLKMKEQLKKIMEGNV